MTVIIIIVTVKMVCEIYHSSVCNNNSNVLRFGERQRAIVYAREENIMMSVLFSVGLLFPYSPVRCSLIHSLDHRGLLLSSRRQNNVCTDSSCACCLRGAKNKKIIVIHNSSQEIIQHCPGKRDHLRLVCARYRGQLSECEVVQE